MKRIFSSRASYFFRTAVSFPVSFINLVANIWLKATLIFLDLWLQMDNEPEKRKVGRPRLPITDLERQDRHREAMRRYWHRNKIVLSQKAKMKRKVARDAI